MSLFFHSILIYLMDSIPEVQGVEQVLDEADVIALEQFKKLESKLGDTP